MHFVKLRVTLGGALFRRKNAMISLQRVAKALAVFVLMVSPVMAQPTVTSVVNAASFQRFVCAGAIASIFGTGLAPSTARASSVPLPTTLGGVTVTVDGIEAPLYFVSPRQINVQLPFGITAARVSLVVRTPQGDSAAIRLDLLPTAPGVFTVAADGTGTPVLLSPDFSLLDTVRPGQRVILYATGLGPVEAGDDSLQRAVEEPEVYFGNQQAVVEFAGLAPGFPGVFQLNVVVLGPFVSEQIRLIAGGWPSKAASFPADLPPPVTASERMVSEDRVVEEFRRIQLFIVASNALPGALRPAVEARVGEAPSLRIEAPDNILPLITTTVRDGALKIGIQRPLSQLATVTIQVGVPVLDRVELYGVGSISASGVSGQRFEVRMVGVGTVTASGAVESVDVLGQGVGTTRLFDLASESAKVWLSGVGTVEVNATQSLFARVFGLGTVFYSGNPGEIDAVVEGFGSIQPR